MDLQNIAAYAGGIGGSVLGILGGLVGTYCSIRNTSGPRERAFVVRAAVLCWVLLGALLAGIALLPHPFNLLLIVPHAALLHPAIRYWNRTQERIRREESAEGS
jgi:hypothetical protein